MSALPTWRLIGLEINHDEGDRGEGGSHYRETSRCLGLLEVHCVHALL